MSKSETNSVDNPCGYSGLDTSEHENCPIIPGSSVEEVNLEQNIIPRKRSKFSEEVNLNNIGEGKYSTSSKRQKGNISTSLSDMPRVRRNRVCQAPNISSALTQSRRELRSDQNLELLVPNNEMTASTSRNYNNLDSPSTSHNSNQNSAVNSRSRKKRSMKRKKPNETNTEENVKATHKKQENNFEEELICSICSEIFINAVTLNCSHSFCKYCILQWRKNNATCPICRQIISSQNSTLVLDKCVEKVLQTSDEEKKEYRKNLIAYREEHTDETLLFNVPNHGAVNNNVNGTANNNHTPFVFTEENGWPATDDNSSIDDYDFLGANHNISDDEFADINELRNFYNVDPNNVDDNYDDDNGYQNEDDIDDSLDVYDGYHDWYYGYSSSSETHSVSGNERDEDSEYTDEEEYESQLEDEEIEGDEEESSCEEYDDEEDYESSAPSIDEVICYNCGVAGHFARRCPKGVAYTGKRGAYYGGYGTCFKCNMEGHWANGCPN